MPRIRMIDGFNEDCIDLESEATKVRKGGTPLDTVLAKLVTLNTQS